MKKIIIHCGMPKTGTSAIQVQFAQGRKNFLKHGYDYLNTGVDKKAEKGGISSGNGFELARAYMPQSHPSSLAKQRKNITEKTRRAIHNTDCHVIISSEFFSATTRPLLGELAASFSDLGEVNLAFFVREQTTALVSSYIQQIKRRGETKFPDEFSSDFDIQKQSMLLYNSYFTELSFHIDNANILAKPYELAKSNPAGVLGLFLDMIGAKIPLEDLPVDKRVNLSPSPQELRLLIEVNKHEPSKYFSDMVVELSYAAGRSNIYAPQVILPPEVAKKVKTLFHKENEDFFINFAKCNNIYDNEVDNSSYINLRDVTFDATVMVDVFAGVLSRLDKRLEKLEQTII
ncbi:hypothetical protein SAMN05444339_1333 [Loktanella atrilutea]|uniref:Uncharacterized protein n=1 Tax=Loktanella atrilutea TaxID=366533 RepID=A0A1M5G2W4_LOKAT|nr:hypothetical protein [Loktanella atrilutea]SHF98046.1 hypothetical protein SAMN05444339_1333 [Loktanella atrilutea]